MLQIKGLWKGIDALRTLAVQMPQAIQYRGSVTEQHYMKGDLTDEGPSMP